VLYEGIQPGGQLTITDSIENFPGFPEEISGTELMDKMREQVDKFNVDVRPNICVKTNLGEKPYHFWFDNGTEVKEHHVMIHADGCHRTFLQQLNAVLDAYNQLIEQELKGSTAVFKRYFLSDASNQADDVIMSDTSDCAKSIIEQAPLDGSKIVFSLLSDEGYLRFVVEALGQKGEDLGDLVVGIDGEISLIGAAYHHL
jgi:hypothetical protein